MMTDCAAGPRAEHAQSGSTTGANGNKEGGRFINHVFRQKFGLQRLSL